MQRVLGVGGRVLGVGWCRGARGRRVQWVLGGRVLGVGGRLGVGGY